MGASPQKAIQSLLEDYLGRLRKFHRLEMTYLGEPKKWGALSAPERKEREAQLFMEAISPTDYLILLDEKGREFRSRQMAQALQDIFNRAPRRLVFVIGGPYGFAERLYQRADEQWALSRLTFPHDLVRVLFLEQLYRSVAILHHLPYHHD